MPGFVLFWLKPEHICMCSWVMCTCAYTHGAGNNPRPSSVRWHVSVRCSSVPCTVLAEAEDGHRRRWKAEVCLSCPPRLAGIVGKQGRGLVLTQVREMVVWAPPWT